MARRGRRTKVTGVGARTGSSTGLPAVATQGKVNGVPNVQYTRIELRNVVHLYDKIRDCISGSHAVKTRGDVYLPRPNATDDSDANLARYDAYLKRAVFYNVTRRTVLALVGQIFLRAPQVDIPTSLDPLKLDANGENVTLEQIASTTAQYVLAYGRAGLLVDFPTLSANVTMADLDKGDLRPTINVYPGREIINWRKALRGARSVYTLIVVREEYTDTDDGFEARTSPQYKVLRLVPVDQATQQIRNSFPADWEDMFGDALIAATSSKTDIYKIEVWRGSSEHTGFNLAQEYFPKDNAGNFLNEIPWMFVGAEKNDDSVDHPPMADMAELNISHYLNSADYEESVFVIGQPTPYVSGVTEEWNQNVLKGTLQLGSRGLIALPNGGTAGLLQAEPNTLASEAMEKKERQMVALGAKLVEQRQVQRTATEAQMEGTSDTSILANIAKNVSTAMEWSVKKACVFTGDNQTAVSFILNTEFDLTRMDPQERAQLLEEYVTGGIAFTEYRANLRRGGVATLDDEEATAAIAKDQADRLAADVARATAIAATQPQKPVKPGAKSPVAKQNQTDSNIGKAK